MRIKKVAGREVLVDDQGVQYDREKYEAQHGPIQGDAIQGDEATKAPVQAVPGEAGGPGAGSEQETQEGVGPSFVETIAKMSIAEVQSRVNDPEQGDYSLQAVHAAELAGSKRRTLLEWLERQQQGEQDEQGEEGGQSEQGPN